MQRWYLRQLVGLTSVLACATAAAPAAQAGVIIVTAAYSGFVGGFPGAQTVDTLGAFGAPGSDLSGLPYTMTFVEKDSKTTHSFITNSMFSLDSDTGPMSASLQIGTSSFSVSSTGSIENLNYTSSGYNTYDSTVTKTVNITPSFSYFELFNSSISLPFLLPSAPNYHSYILSGAKWVAPTRPGFGGSFDLFPSISSAPQEVIDLLPNTLTVTSVDPPSAHSAAPEPASWALTICGLFGLGAALRRRGAPLAA